LGLPICQSIVASLGGSIKLESEVGRGTLCRITVPRASGAGADAEEVPRAIPLLSDDSGLPSIRRSRILVVDDEPALLQSLARELGQQHDVTCTASGANAIELMLAQAFDVVLCDLMMPSVSGIDVYETIRRKRPGLERLLVFMTAGAFTSTAREFLRSI